MGSKSQSFLQLLKTRGFISYVPFKVDGKNYYIHKYGAPGTLLRHNIKQQWWKTMVSMKSNVFPVETTQVQTAKLASIIDKYEDSSRENFFGRILRDNLESDCRDKYLEVLTLSNSRLPFSIASIGDTFCVEGDSCDIKDPEQVLFTRQLVTTQMLLQNYVAPSGSSRVFDFWLQHRLSWWKKFSNNPSKFRIISTTGNGKDGNGTVNGSSSSLSGAQSMSIVYNFPWGQDTLEVIKNMGDEELLKLQNEQETVFTAKATGAKNVLPYCIQCSANLDSAMAAFLADSFHERRPPIKSKSKKPMAQILQLHPHLSPFQVAIVLTASQTTATKELLIISKQLEHDLINAQVSVFNASEHVGSLDAHFNRNDQLGIPYTLILNENTLKDGVLHSRDRDTEIKKPVHVSRAVEEISRNVKAVLE